MISNFDINNLNLLLKDFYTALGIKISIFDDEFHLVTEYPSSIASFCKLIRRSDEGTEACHKCDKDACTRAKKLMHPHIYTCHAGLTEAITPIQISGGVIGYAILAHMLYKDNLKNSKNIAINLAKMYGVAEKEAKDALKEITPKSKEQIDAMVKILDAFSSYLNIQNLATWKNEAISDQIKEYILTNISKKITSNDICEKFNLSRASLYNLSMKAYGIGINEYITKLRINKAKEMLSENNSISDTAYLCGFNEYNYFCKVFKKAVGVSPNTYKKAKNK